MLREGKLCGRRISGVGVRSESRKEKPWLGAAGSGCPCSSSSRLLYQTLSKGAWERKGSFDFQAVCGGRKSQELRQELSRDQEETLFTDLLCHLSYTFYHLPPTFLGSQAGQIVLLPPSFVRIQTDPNPSLDPSLEVREGRCLSFLWHSIADTKCSTNHGDRLHNHKAGSLLLESS